jgi:GxxExxY protein
MKFDDLSCQVIGKAMEVHNALGPGLLESAYEQCQLSDAGIPFRRQYPLPVVYKEIKLECGYRIDLFVDDKIIVEIKSVEQLNRIHEAQLLTYMKLIGAPVGLLINFNVRLLKDGIRRFVI